VEQTPMVRIKGMTVEFLKREINKAKLEFALLDQLTVEEQELYTRNLPLVWHDIEQATAVLEKGAKLLYPDATSAMYALGYHEAKDHLKGIYRVLMRVITVPFIAKQTAKLWTTYYDRGIGRTELHANEKALTVFISGVPEMSALQLQKISGYVQSTMEMSGEKNVRAQIDARDAQEWKWVIRWD
jgi:hypothetical protein